MRLTHGSMWPCTPSASEAEGSVCGRTKLRSKQTTSSAAPPLPGQAQRGNTHGCASNAHDGLQGREGTSKPKRGTLSGNAQLCSKHRLALPDAGGHTHLQQLHVGSGAGGMSYSAFSGAFSGTSAVCLS
jgi:hypothetical protein